MKYRCTKGHDRCGEMYAGPECPLCERVPARAADKLAKQRDASPLKEWPTPVWTVVKNGDPIDYAFSRAGAFKKAAGYRVSQPGSFWTVARGHGAVVLKVIR